MPKLALYTSFDSLRRKVVSCRLCPRLVAFREGVMPSPTHAHETYWRRPVPGFGDKQAWLLVVGLAPAGEGGNRTGRIFTGDLTSQFLIKALYKAGFANQPESISLDDGLELTGCYLTAVVKCLPPLHKPLPIEIRTCNRYFQNEMLLLPNLTHVLVLGKVAFDACRLTIEALTGEKLRIKFQHGVRYELPGGLILHASYHPSPQNTNTGKLTERMFLGLLQRIRSDE